MSSLEGRVAIITGAGRGIGREHALLFAQEGARVVVNDRGAATDGSGSDLTPAQQVVEEIRALGGEAIANSDNVADWEGSKRLVTEAVEAFGELHVLVNNAGILRDKFLVNMDEAEWDSVVDVHLKGTFCTLHWAAAYWRDKAKAGDAVKASVINTASGSGLFGNPGQANYAAAKAGIASLTLVAARELERYGVRVNAIAPLARTRLTLQTPGFDAVMGDPEAVEGFDPWDPANISPLVAYLAGERCAMTGRTFGVHGGRVELYDIWPTVERVERDGRWTPAELEAALKGWPEGQPPFPGI